MRLWLPKSSGFRPSWKCLSSMRAGCHCSSEVTITGFWRCLRPFGCVTQWHKCWIQLLSWGSCHDNCAAAGECPAPEFLRRARGHWYSEWLWNIAGARDPFLYFCQCLLLSHWGKCASGVGRYLGRKKESRFLFYFFDFKALSNDSNFYYLVYFYIWACNVKKKGNNYTLKC